MPKPKPATRPTKEQLKKIKDAILQKLEQDNVAVRNFHDAALITGDDVNHEEDGTIYNTQIQNLAQADQCQAAIRSLLDALKRIEDGDPTFGKCSKCSMWIPYERLLLVPTATLCTRCQTIAEGKGRHFD